MKRKHKNTRSIGQNSTGVANLSDLHIKLNVEKLKKYCLHEGITMKYYVQEAVKEKMKRDNI